MKNLLKALSVLGFILLITTNAYADDDSLFSVEADNSSVFVSLNLGF